MGRRSRFTMEQKINAVLDYKKGEKSAPQICNTIGLLSIRNFYKWVHIYDNYGESGLLPKERNKSYSKNFKQEVIISYLNGEGSLEELSLKYNIPSLETLRTWFLSYNSHIELKDYSPQGDVYMTKARKTTLQERIEIVTYCIEHGKQYKLATKE